MKEYTNDYYIVASGVIERGIFYNYMHELGYKDHFMWTREQMVNSLYPFAVCMELKELCIIESATLCYLNEKAGKFRTVEEFKEIVGKKKI